MSTKHTPGPWELRNQFGMQGLVYPAGLPHPVCCVTGYYIQDGQAEPNATLISAAPELLDALSEAKRIFDWLESRSLYQDKDLRGVHDKMRAAIAKATGGAA